MGFIVSMRLCGDDHPVPVALFVLFLAASILSLFGQGWMFDFDEPLCIKHVGYVETSYSWKHQEKTFDYDGETHKISELLDYEQVDVDNIPDSVMVFQYIYSDFGFISPSYEFFIYSENPTKYTTEGACITTAETK
ncbi:MAG: hypothetical protein P8J32_07495 [bacterium]|nr:hypothetical protein [bacterium]